ncbi:MAG: heat-shock protein Hsp20 [Deltaproteobacteria bacterium RIFOXYD12_FULL_57_12]|nr:MAG: heat-shock protein Hsp20 [Deltaproteobacteria bacterium RIFOXYD12_FULL_57_12]
MTLIRFTDRPLPRNPWAELEKFKREMDMLWPRFFGGETAAKHVSSVYPPLNISENADNIFIRAELPGIQANDLEIFIEGDTLTIKGERRSKKANEKTSYHRQELEYGRFSRAVALPTKVDADKITALVENGILTITLPKAEEAKPRQITVKAS